MSKVAPSAARTPKFHLRSRPVWVAVTLVVAAGLGWGGHAAWTAFQTWGTPTCSWPLQTRGTFGPAQSGLVRCYVRDLANHDSSGLMAVAADIPPVRITSADLAYSADARAGQATATFTPSPVDTNFWFVTIRYADGTTEETSMMNMIAMGGPSGWRMTIGTNVSSGPSGPPPAVASPSS